jgi:hypothetical protein
VGCDEGIILGDLQELIDQPAEILAQQELAQLCSRRRRGLRGAGTDRGVTFCPTAGGPSLAVNPFGITHDPDFS